MPTWRALIMHKSDNVATAIDEIPAGDMVAARLGGEVVSLPATDRIPFGYKIALEAIPSGGLIVKYGEPIGRANTDIPRGGMVHVHNLEGIRARGDLERGAGR